MKTFNVSEFAKAIGVCVETLQRWDKRGKLVPNRTPTNRRVYTEEHLSQVLGAKGKCRRLTVVYLRVSSQGQKPDLANQQKAIEQFCLAKGIAVDEWVREIGGGLNFTRKKFIDVIDRVLSGEIERIIVAHQDRLMRFGFAMAKHLCESRACEIMVLNTESLSPEQEMVQDMLAITHCFSARLYGLRNYRKALQKALHDDQSAQNPVEPHA